jgi:NhaP-type Na+/H+ or K+/H+ antiporter
MFYQEISFFLKTFFFVYIGILLNVKNLTAVGIGLGTAVAVMLLRNISMLMTKSYKPSDRVLINSLFGRGIAPAAILLMATEKQLLMDQTIIDTVYFIITATIILSSLRVFFYKRKVTK